MLGRFLIVVLLCSVYACNGDDDLSGQRDGRSNIIGDWEVNLIVEEIRSDTVYSESSDLRTISFNADGTGSRETFFIESEPMEWYYQADPEKVVIISESEFNPSLSSTQVHSVIENNEDSQVWQYEIIPISGSVDKYVNTWKMTRE